MPRQKRRRLEELAPDDADEAHDSTRGPKRRPVTVDAASCSDVAKALARRVMLKAAARGERSGPTKARLMRDAKAKKATDSSKNQAACSEFGLV